LIERVRKEWLRQGQKSLKQRRIVHFARPVADRQTWFERLANMRRDHERWFVPTCIAGATASLIAGGVFLGFIGQNATPNEAYASIGPAEAVKADIGGEAGSTIAPKGSAELPVAESVKVQQVALVVPERDLDGEQAYPQITTDELPYGNGKTVVLDAEIDAIANEDSNITTITKSPPPEPVDESFKIAKGRTIVDELVDRGVTKDSAKALLAALEPVFPAKMMKQGTEFELTLDQQQDFYGRYVIFPVRLAFKPGPKEEIVVEADEDGQFIAKIDGEETKKLSRYAEVTQFHSHAKVGSSLYATAQDNGVPDYITAELMRVFSYNIDFQRQVKASDSFDIFYGNPLTGSSTKRKVLHYAQLTLGGRTKTLYRFTTADGQTDYFDDDGQSATRALLMTPVSGAKLTSGFGMRRHPLLGYTKMHTGLDFGVPYGTPIRAAGSGTIDSAGWHGAYGNAVIIQHNGRFETLYGHMSRIAAGIRSGERVNQGQIIGYVGSTGRSTGPHLHYEVRVDDRPINPARIKSAGGRQLAGKDLMDFRRMKVRVVAMMRTAPSATQVALAQSQ
jgi:murein DD-endopeptidase MepM/ murein hydrolase activator NlpD